MDRACCAALNDPLQLWLEWVVHILAQISRKDRSEATLSLARSSAVQQYALPADEVLEQQRVALGEHCAQPADVVLEQQHVALAEQCAQPADVVLEQQHVALAEQCALPADVALEQQRVALAEQYALPALEAATSQQYLDAARFALPADAGPLRCLDAASSVPQADAEHCWGVKRCSLQEGGPCCSPSPAAPG